MKKRIGILTGGGDVQALNVVIESAKTMAEELDIALVGIIKGWEGLYKENFIDLSALSIGNSIGGTILKSSRISIENIVNGIGIVKANLLKENISGLIVIGGEDTLSNSFLLRSVPQVLISKTIDNDVGKIVINKQKFQLEDIFNYFTLGFPTAAEKISSFVSFGEGLRTTAYSHERIIIVESMGMHAGWLALASGIGHPDFIIIPEFPLDYELLLNKVVKKYEKQKHLIIVVAEGSKWKNGGFINAQDDEIASHRHPRFGGSSEVLKKHLKKDLAEYFNTRNINAVNPSYLYRCGKPNKLDRFWAEKLGKAAVKLLSEGINESCFLSIEKMGSGFEIKEFPLAKFSSIDELHRFVDEKFYNPDEFRITENGMKYLKGIVREMPYDKSYGLNNRLF